MRCGNSPASWDCRNAWSAATPFPGPGLAIRMPGAVTREKLAILRKADLIYLDEIRKAGFTTRSGRPSPCCCR